MDLSEALEILERKNYVRVTEKLRGAVAEAAEAVAAKMSELELSEMKIEGEGTLVSYRVNSNISSAQLIGWGELNEWGDYEVCDLDGQKEHTYYLHGDFNCVVSTAPREDYLKFALAYAKILMAIEAAEIRCAAEAQEALAGIPAEDRPSC